MQELVVFFKTRAYNNHKPVKEIVKMSDTGQPGFNPEQLVQVTDYVTELQTLSEIRGDLHHLGSEEGRTGTVHHYGLVNEAGYGYGGHVSIPHEPSSPIAVAGTAAWLTSTLGLNEHTMRVLMSDGLPGVFLGNEGSYRPGFLPPKPEVGMSLGLTAATSLQFNRAVSEVHPELDPVRRTAIGESKGDMEGGAVMWLDEFFGMEYLMANFTAGCFPRRLQLGDIPDSLRQVAQEPLQAAKLAGRIAGKVLFHLPSTIDPHPYAWAGQVGKVTALLSGEAGDHARMIRKDRIIHKTIFSGDAWSMQEEWAEIFGTDYPNVRITPLEGSHITLADPETLAYTRAREKAFRILFAAHDNQLYDTEGELLFSGDQVFDLAHEYVHEFLPELPQNPAQKVVRFIFGDRSHQSEKPKLRLVKAA